MAGNIRKTEMKNEIMSCVYKKQGYLPNIPRPLDTRLGLEVQHHTTLRFPHDHSPGDANFDQRGLN